MEQLEVENPIGLNKNARIYSMLSSEPLKIFAINCGEVEG